jgi:catechol 2,3-dioxygenase-like lactoylglutathione lyase family enzyme
MKDVDARISSTVLGCPDPQTLAGFYREFLGWTTVHEQPDWVAIKPADGGHGMAFQLEQSYARPAWPAGPGEQQMQAHLDIGVTDLEAGVQRAESLGATQAAFQPQADVRVMLDPVGHPFCLFARA